MRLTARSVRAVFLPSLLVAVAAGQPLLDSRSVSGFLRELQRALERDDRAAVSTLIRYPLILLAGGVRIPINDAAALRQSYDVVFTPALKNLIARAAAPGRGLSRPAAAVAITADVATVGVDAVRIEPVGKALKITRITIPLAAPATESGGSARRERRAPDTLRLDVGQLQRAGALAPGEHDAYVLSAGKNRLLEVRITGVSGRDIVARISAVKSGAPVDSRAGQGVRTWIGRIPEDGEYRIDVVRLAAGGAPRLEYLMVVVLR